MQLRISKTASAVTMLMVGVTALATACSSGSSASGSSEAVAASSAPASEAASAAASASGSCEVTAQELLVGATLPLTGALGVYGKSMLQGLELGLKDAEATLGGDTFKLDAEDNGAEAGPSVTLARKMMTDGALTVVTAAAAPPLAQLPLAEEYQVPLLNGAGNTPDLEGHDWLFNTAFMQTVGGRAAMTFAHDTLGVNNLSVILTSDYPQATGPAFQEIWNGLAGQTPEVQFVPIDATDAGPFIDKALAENPEALYLAASGTALELLLTQLEQRGSTIPVISGDGALLAAPVANTVSFPIYYANPALPASAEMAAAYKEAYGSDPDFLSVQNYNVGRVIGDAVKVMHDNCQDVTGANLQAILADTAQKYIGDGGVELSFNENRVAVQPASIIKVEGGKSETAAESVPIS